MVKISLNGSRDVQFFPVFSSRISSNTFATMGPARSTFLIQSTKYEPSTHVHNTNYVKKI